VQRAYGAWPSPITAQLVAAQGVRVGGVSVAGDVIYWLEGRPAEGGRTVLLRRDTTGRVAELTPVPFDVRSRVHEYGGMPYAIDEGWAWFVNFADQRIYRTSRSASQSWLPPQALTLDGAWCYADLIVDRERGRLICVREDHTHGATEPVTTLVSIPLAGGPSAGEVLVQGDDFYSTPRLSPDGSRLSWLAWRHPQMPWDGTELWVAHVSADGALEDRRLVTGGPAESVYQPGWSPDGVLYFVSDRDGWWRLYRVAADRRTNPSAERSDLVIEPVLADPPPDVEFGRAAWVFGTATWAFADRHRLVVSFTRGGTWHLGTIDVARSTLQPLPTGLEPHEWLAATPTQAVLVAGTPHSADALLTVDLDTGKDAVIRAGSGTSVDAGYVSVPEAIRFPSGDGEVAYAFYYPPRNRDCEAPPGALPPLIAIGHGGPTTATRATLDVRVQYWTSRGFAVVDVNYGGSTGYGRRYRERLNGRWGIVDVMDVVAAARHLVDQGKADPKRLVIRGGSAGGYTTLAALTFRPDVFAAGASYYGICDLEVLARDTHKFESRYLDTLVGPYPDLRDEYRARSPIHFVDRLNCALILFQGLEDKVVPPNQSAMMAAAVRAKGLPVALLTFAGEQHGFRRADTIIRCLEAELFFYGEVFGFTPADAIEPLPIANLRR
jgi:dipeptidyl aminopeptidase/acylaminoacyl peptidase